MTAFIVVCLAHGRVVLRQPDPPRCLVPHWTKDDARAIEYPDRAAAQEMAYKMTRLMRGCVATVEARDAG